MFAASPVPAKIIYGKGQDTAMSLFVIHVTKPSRDGRDALPCVRGVRPAKGGRFHSND